MPSIARIKSSDGTKNASVATVTTTRSAGATTILVDTVAGIPTDFCATMGAPHTFTDPVTGETITLISEVSAVDFEGHVNGTNLEIDTIAPGYTDAGSAVGDIVVIKPTTQWANNVADVLAVSLDDDGKVKAAMPVTGSAAFTVEPLTGWINDPNTFTYVSGTGTITAVFKVSGVDVTDHLQAGMPFAAVQGGVTKYGFITKVAFSTDTTITALMAATNGTVDDSGIANATITSFKFGLPKRPGFGFPLDPAKWTVSLTDTSDHLGSVGTTWTNTGSLSLTAPIGLWNPYFSGSLVGGRAQANTGRIRATLSTANNTESSNNNTVSMALTTSGTTVQLVVPFEKHLDPIDVATATPYYLNFWAEATNTLGVQGSEQATLIRFVCAYL